MSLAALDDPGRAREVLATLRPGQRDRVRTRIGFEGLGGRAKQVGNLDEALERFHLGGLEYAGGLANHGPMAAEALAQLGHQALIPALVGLYAARLPVAEVGSVLSDSEQGEALGDISRAPDWIATYDALIDAQDWRRVLADRLPALIPGLFAGAGHGFLRTAHALRSLEAEDSPLRRRELARGLAYWSARFQRLPGKVGTGTERADAVLAGLPGWPLVAEAESRRGFFFDSIRRLDRFPAFASAVERLALPGPAEIDGFISALCRAAAALYRSHPAARVAYVHALTIPSAARIVTGYLAPDDACLLAASVFQATTAMHSLFGDPKSAPETDEEVDRITENWDEIRYHAACSLEVHSIKMVEACWREDKIRPDPIFRRAAADAALKIDPRGQAAEC